MKRYFIKGSALIGGDVDVLALKAEGYGEISKREYDKLFAEFLENAKNENKEKDKKCISNE